MTKGIRAWAVVLAIWGSAAAAENAPRPTLAVMDLEAKGPPPLQVEAVTAGVVRGIRELDVFNVLAAEDVRQLLAIERSRQLLGGDASAKLPLVDVLGARDTVVGTVRGTADALTVELRLLDTASQKVRAEKTLGPAPLQQVLKDVGGIAQELLGPLLQEQQGRLVVQASEEGAELRVDDVLRGSTPLKEPLTLPRGTHRLEVRKDGFITAIEPVQIQPDATAVKELRLVPSPDYAEAWKQRHGRLRVGAWISTVVAVGAIGGAVFLDRTADTAYRQEFLPRKYALDGTGGSTLSDPEQQRVFAQCLTDQRTVCTEQTRAVAGDIAARQYGTIGLASLGAIATGVAAYLWLTGEDPNRYSKLVAGVTLGSTNGFAVAGSF
ncbi:MAG: PEGA domain-containing protein [Myxococcaceae bacterium]|nr:PEGA domain-containing protein [Myxococcaceae bacterium]